MTLEDYCNYIHTIVTFKTGCILGISPFWQGAGDHAFVTGPNSKSYRRRKARTVFSDHQLQGLEKRFECQRYLSTPERIELAAALNLSETQVR